MYRLVKKIEDLTLALLILFFLTPFLIVIIFLSIIIQGRPVFYVSKRMISKQKEISIYKFRTMVRDAKEPKYNLEGKYMVKGYLDIPLESEVYTALGRFLEKTQLVEVPQIFHIFSGKLSFIGNRPLPKKNVDLLKESFPNTWQKRFNCPAGLTGIAQVVGKFNLSPKKRIELESLYANVYNHGNVLKADAYIFFSTIILVLLRRPSAYRSYEKAKSILESCLPE